MADEQERLERAKQKLLKMNQKVQHAQNISKKRTPVKGPPPREEKVAKTPQKSGTTYVFELTEAMLADGFDEEEVVRYVEQVEAESKASEIELDQRELAVKADLKKISRAIERIKNPKAPASPVKPRKERPREDERPATSVDSPGYSAIHQTRKSPKNEVKRAQIAVTPKKAPISPPKKTSPRKTSDADTPAVKATGAGAKFLADLADDDDDCDNPF